ncbi:early light-induced protein 1 [Pyrus ussuriensis x Pyrus communis]|uniref:Early light-induced protein 1 n=1 Tax=Pyrus ussuriensis x Pyrus communis TaxID=2448454 RepID=A0A5N5FN48_9ROSA|nr:early light-induced protein 1, chloroplastic [Pyrus x bretschneideri]KAB2599704.1 early light-induced protein 1 [Pyrus ussuriensis x Pyrus communis]
MAASASMQSLLANSVVYGAGKSRSARVIHLVPANRYRHMVVRSMAENGQEEQSSSTIPEASKTPPPPRTPTPSPPPPKKVSTKFSDVFAFSGPAPERINGRLAMVGFVSALAVELSKGQDVFTQISDGGVSLFLATSILLSVASVIPLFKGVSVESKSNGIMTSDAELWNGRLAMLGLVALAFTEYVKGGTLV